MRTQEEVIERINEVDDFFGFEQRDLIQFLDFEHAQEFFKEEFVEQVKQGKEKWETTDAKKTILEYLPFAYQKAEDERGLSAGRSMKHFRAWIWFDDPEFFEKVLPLIDNYTDYGIPALDAISEHYGFKR